MFESTICRKIVEWKNKGVNLLNIMFRRFITYYRRIQMKDYTAWDYVNPFCTISRTRRWSIATFFSVFFPRVYFARSAVYVVTRPRNVHRAEHPVSLRPPVTSSSRPCFSPRRNIRGIDVFVSLKGRPIRPWKMEKPVPLPVSRMRRRSLHARTHTGVSSAADTHLRSSISSIYLSTDRGIQAESWCVRKRVPDSFYFLRALFLRLAVGRTKPTAGHGA